MTAERTLEPKAATEVEADVAVIGGGIIGLSCALELARSGHSVVVVEAGKIGAGSSSGNCGLVTPSLAVPLARPGRMREVLRSLFKPDSPLFVQPRLSLELLAWGLAFARRCRREAMLEGMRERAQLLQRSRSLFPAFYELSTSEVEVEWRATGHTLVFREQAEWQAFGEEARLLRDLGVEAQAVEGDRLLADEPLLCDEVIGGWHFPGDAQLRPEALLERTLDLLGELGGKILEQSEVTSFEKDADRIRCARTRQGVIRAREFVLATGAWAPQLARSLGMRIPIQPGKGYSLTFDSSELAPRKALVFHENHVAATPWRDSFRLGGTMEFAGYDTRLNEARIASIRAGAARYLREVPRLLEARCWFGWRPMTPSGLPSIRRPAGVSNLIVAVGHNMLGLSMAPATAERVAEMLASNRGVESPRHA